MLILPDAELQWLNAEMHQWIIAAGVADGRVDWAVGRVHCGIACA